METSLLQHVECLLEERVFEEETARIAVASTAVRVTRFVQRLSKNLQQFKFVRYSFGQIRR